MVYAPGYILASLNANGHELGVIPFSILSIGGDPLETPAIQEERAWNRRVFTKPQREVIAEYLRFLITSDVIYLDEGVEFSIEKILHD